jgi:hypothetical protein
MDTYAASRPAPTAVNAMALHLRPVSTRAHFSIHLRARAPQLLIDRSGSAGEFAVYTLADPRDVMDVRYVGQTRSPRQRFFQHVNKARLWVPDELPWWIKLPRERPLYEWIRELHRDESRLPVMSVMQWHDDAGAAVAAERALIRDCLEGQLRLLNVEAERAKAQPAARSRRRAKR